MLKRQCFYIPESQSDEQGWIPSLFTENEPGHAPLTGNGPCAAPWHWGRTLEEARAFAEQENARTFGLTPDDSLAILLSSIRAGGGT
jgi:hypothetical protein